MDPAAPLTIPPPPPANRNPCDQIRTMCETPGHAAFLCGHGSGRVQGADAAGSVVLVAVVSLLLMLFLLLLLLLLMLLLPLRVGRDSTHLVCRRLYIRHGSPSLLTSEQIGSNLSGAVLLLLVVDNKFGHVTSVSPSVCLSPAPATRRARSRRVQLKNCCRCRCRCCCSCCFCCCCCYCRRCFCCCHC